MRQYLRMFAAMIMMAFGVAAHAEQINYDPAKVSDSLRAVFQFGSVSTKNALNANTVTLLTGTVGGTYVQLGADLASVLDDDGNLRVLSVTQRESPVRFDGWPVSHLARTQTTLSESLWPPERITGKARSPAKRRPPSA